MKKPAFFYLIFFFVFLNIVDILTTIFILPGESNPLYLMTKSFVVILIFKIAIVSGIVWLYYHNTYTNKTVYYSFICMIVYGSLALLIAQVSNIYAILTPAVLAQAAQATVQEKTAGYNNFMLTIYLLPLLFSMICFMIYNHSVDYINIKKKELKKWK